MSSMAYVDLKDDKMEVDEQKFEDNFRALPSPSERNEGYKIGPLFPQVEIDWKKMITKLREEYDSKWLTPKLGKGANF